MLTEELIRTLKDPEFRENMVRHALSLNELNGGEIHRELEILGHVFLTALNEVLPFEGLSLDEEAVVRDAVRTHLHHLRIHGDKIPRRKGLYVVFTPRNFEYAQAAKIREFADDLQIELFVELLKTKIQVHRLVQRVEEVTLEAKSREVDQLMQIPTRRYGAEQIRKRVEEAPEKPVAVILLDVDHFTHFNTTYGHPGGDKVLKRVARIIRTQIHSEDIAVRYGGEEILVFVEVDTQEQAIKVAQRLRLAIQKGTNPKVTISVGVEFAPRKEILAEASVEGSFEDGNDLVTLDDAGCNDDGSYDNDDNGDASGVDINGPATERADRALYRAKGKDTNTGRNRVWAAWKDNPEPRNLAEEEEADLSSK